MSPKSAAKSRLDCPNGAPRLGLCVNQPCWKMRALGVLYKDKEATPDGMFRVGLRAGTPAKLTV